MIVLGLFQSFYIGSNNVQMSAPLKSAILNEIQKIKDVYLVIVL